MARHHEIDDRVVPDGLSEPQQRRVLVTCMHVDKLLHEVEEIVAATSSRSPFPQYEATLPPAETAVVEQAIASIREFLVSALDQLDVPRPVPRGDAVFAIRTMLTYADIAVEELRPTHMKGYGPMAPRPAAELGAIVDRLCALIKQLDRFLTGVVEPRRAGSPTARPDTHE